MPTTPRARSWFLLVTAGTGLAAGCGGKGPAQNARVVRVEVAAPIAEECPEEVVPPGMDRLGVSADDGTPIGAATLGSGGTAVVLVHGSGQDPCDWLPFVPQLAALGVTVVAYDMRGRGSSGGSRNEAGPLPDDLAAVVQAARDGGAERVVLVGTSLGAATALVASGRIEPAVDAVVAISPPVSLGSMDVASEAARFTGPIHLLAAKGDDIFAKNVEELSSVLPTVQTSTVLEGDEHGMRLLEAHPVAVIEAIRQAVEEAGGP